MIFFISYTLLNLKGKVVRYTFTGEIEYLFVCFLTIQVNITFMENCYDFCFRLGKGKFTKYFIDLQVCPEETYFFYS